MNVIYEQHPVSAERKKELNGAGYKIIDAQFRPKSESAENQNDVELPVKEKRRGRK